MRTPEAFRASSVVALAIRILPAVPYRTFHTFPRCLQNTGSGGKPTENSKTQRDGDGDIGSQIDVEPSGGRTKVPGNSSIRARHTRKHIFSALPPVELTDSFFENNVTIFYRGRPFRLPVAIAEDTRNAKVSRLFCDQSLSSRRKGRAFEKFFAHELHVLLKKQEALIEALIFKLSYGGLGWDARLLFGRLTRTWGMIIDTTWHLFDAIRPSWQAEYTYHVRPYWWWKIYKDFDHRNYTFRNSDRAEADLITDDSLEYPLSHIISDLPPKTLASLSKYVAQDLLIPPPPEFDSRTSKRPINILSLFGYGGRAISEAVGEYIALVNSADLVRLNAFDLSFLVSDYLGQNWAYTRSSVSMLGFRAAELNGRLARELDDKERHNDEENEVEHGPSGMQNESGMLDEELRKAKQNTFECFTKWENLKLDKVLDHIIRSASIKSPSPKSRPLILQVHDIVELSMTLEGSFIISRLRALADAAWHQGTKITLLGTSSCEQPSEEYRNAIKELAVQDFVITRHIQPDQADKETISNLNASFLTLQKTDYFTENLQNIDRMFRAMDPQNSQQNSDLSIDNLRNCILSAGPNHSLLCDSILPFPEIYRIACSARTNASKGISMALALRDRFTLGPLQQTSGQPYLGEERRDGKVESSKVAQRVEDLKLDSRGGKFNEYEQRIASGKIDRESLRTTFNDVHVPAETISTLKLLTNLAIVRPDAFSYGVLAQDRIPGCLLYGPPGTGKTMLAKAVAKDSGANMLEISGASINDKWVGESEKLIRAVFTVAKRLSPCVVFIDEADALLASRSILSYRSSRREHINQFLKEWDGMEETSAFIMVATNRPFDLDEAVLRRLPRKILVDLPLKEDRAAILRLLLKGETLHNSISLEEYAEQTPYYSGSDLKNLCVAAAMTAVAEENENAAMHKGPDPYRYPDRRVLRKDHFERALKQIPANISEDMTLLKMIREFDDKFGARLKRPKKIMGFNVFDHQRAVGPSEARIRTIENPS